MSESEKILDYLKSYAADNHEVLLSPIVSPIDDRVVSIEVSFNEKEYKRSNFGDIIDMVYETSKNVAWVTDSWIDYRRGSFTIKVNLAHENYNERWIIDTLEKLVKKLSSFRKKK